MKYNKFGILVFTILFLSLVSATFYNGDFGSVFQTDYGPGETISGKINISFENELANSEFRDSFGNSITLLNLLELDDLLSSSDYSCSPLNCDSDYNTLEEGIDKSFVLNEGESKIFGLKISGGKITDISKFSMGIMSGAISSMKRQLEIDIFNDEIMDWKAHNGAGTFNEKNYSCFVEEDSIGQAQITDFPYCQKFHLNETPSIRIGANVQEVFAGAGNVDFILTIYNDDEYGYCTENISSSGEIFCIPEITIDEPTDLFVCIETKTSQDNNKYSLSYEKNEPCGYSGNFNEEYSFDFEIFVQTEIYDGIGSFVLNETELDNQESYNIENQILDYLYTKYGGDCESECVIPINFISNVNNQNIYLSDIKLSYISGISTTTNNIYNLEEEPAEISSDYMDISFNNANFYVPESFGEKTFSLYLDEKRILLEKINIIQKPVIESITPTTTAAALPTIFEVGVNSFDKNITKYDWFFNNSYFGETQENEIEYTFSSTGNYILGVKATNSEGLTDEKNFTISVKAPVEAVNETLIEKEGYLENIKSKITNYDLFTENSLKRVLNLTYKESKLVSIRTSFDYAISSSSSNNQTYIDLMNDLINIEIPEDIEVTGSGDSLDYYPNQEIIDTSFIYDLTSNSFSKEKIWNWFYENVDSKLTFKEISAIKGNSREKIISIYSLNIGKKGESFDALIILKELENIFFEDSDYFENSNGSYFYKDFDGSDEEFTFSTTENIGFSNLPFFISPKESLGPGVPNQVRDYTLIIILIIIVLILVATFVYFLMQVWYKKKYEGSLFKNRNDLYNLVTYINHSKKKGVSDTEIKSHLRKSRWSSEQVGYVTKKYAGKRTGLPGIPIDKIAEKLKNRGKKNNKHK